ncbi:MAG: hypothetical protein HPAVJP_3040 [Candidatus Hepatoplasma vulgare]|nr:MAG: hypothetical protein HPAVJP_3040 [Candidatus Hepatoplasma sp.]
MNFFVKEKNHISLGFSVSFLLLTISGFLIFIIIEEKFGYFLLFLPIIFIIFSILKIIKSFFLLKNLKKLENETSDERTNIYIFENWHKKIVINFWTWIIFLFFYFYITIIYTFLYFFDVKVVADLKYWIYIISIIIISIITFILYKVNLTILSKNINNGKKHFDNVEDRINELKLVSLSVKNDYKFLLVLIISTFLVFPFIFWFFPKFRKKYKEI